MNQIKRFLRRFLPVRIRTYYRGWCLTITSAGAIGKNKASGEIFIIGRLTSIERAMLLAKNKVDRLEGAQEWDQNYENGALR